MQGAITEFIAINEHFELIFNAAMTTQIVFQQPACETPMKPALELP